MELTRKEYDIIAKSRGIIEPQNMSTQELLNTLCRYDSRRKVKTIRRKLSKIGLGKIAKILQKMNWIKLKNCKSIDELKAIARWRRIKSIEKLTKEDLIISLLKSESCDAERNYLKPFDNNTDDDDDTYDDKIRGKISDIRMTLSRLENIVTKND